MKTFTAGGGVKQQQQGAGSGTSVTFNDAAPSWQELAELVKARQAELGVDFWADPEAPDAPTNTMALKRTFGKPGPIRVKLFRDHAAW